jgi:two-component system chemotaxis sensor kinase CheA
MTDDDIRKALLSSFLEEARELLTDLEAVLLELEERPGDEDLIARAFRALHTIKGNGAMFGFTAIESFAHELEMVFDRLRSGDLQVSKALIDLTLASKDQIALMLSEDGEEGEEGEDPAGRLLRERLLEEVRKMASAIGGEEAGERAGKERPAGEEPGEEGRQPVSEEGVYRIRFRPPAEIFGTGPDPAELLRKVGDLGPCRVMALTKEVPPLEELDPTTCFIEWDVILRTEEGMEEIRKIFSSAGGDLRIDLIEEERDVGGEGGERMLGEILVERGDLQREDIEQALKEQKRFGEVLVEKSLADPQEVESALLEQRAVRDLRSRRARDDRADTIRVHSAKLDGLVDLVGELVTVQARLSRLETEIRDAGLTSIAEEVERLTWELRDSAFGIRMVPIGTTFSKFRRLVRDLSTEMGREVELQTEGADTELDKTVIERLNDPLVHLIRNSIDHGIEPPQERVKAGKPRAGTVRLSASQAGADILIEIHDDGAGLDGEAIRRKAIERGLVDEQAHLSPEEIFGLIFLPGFSTAHKLTSVSGRGVGMDVVKTSIDTLSGSVEVRSERGEGTTIVIRLPLTLAIIEGLEVTIAGEHFVLPLSHVVECVELHGRDGGGGEGRHLINVRGELVPYVRLREWFGMPGTPPPIEQTVISLVGNHRVGLVVDHVIGEHQTVIKTLGKIYRKAEGFSGATILGDGTVALILDIPRLVRGAELEEAGRVGSES